jgi:hypothetical protein
MPTGEHRIEWSVDDGFCNPAEHVLQVKSTDFDGSESVDEIVSDIELMLEDAFAQKVMQSWSGEKVRKVAEAIHAELHS